MPRQLREEVAGGLFHVYARGNDRRDIFTGVEDYRRYLVFLVRAVRRQRWNLLAFCLMPNHVHLLIETPEPNLARGMQRAHSGGPGAATGSRPAERPRLRGSRTAASWSS